MRTEVSSFTSTTVAIKAYSESKVTGELNLPGVHCNCQTINWTERRCNTLPIHLEEIQFDFSIYFLLQENAKYKWCLKTNYWPGRPSSAKSEHWHRKHQCTSHPGMTPFCSTHVWCSSPSPPGTTWSSAGCGPEWGRRCRDLGGDGRNHQMFGSEDPQRWCTCWTLESMIE